MRIVDLTTLYIDGGEGGVNTYLLEKARHLETLGAEVEHTVIVPGRRGGQGRLFASTLHTVRSPRLLGNPQHRLLVDFRRVRDLLRQARPDIVEVDCSYLLGHAARRALRPEPVPIVGFYHADLPLLYTRATRNRLRAGITRRTEPFAWRYSEFCARPLSRVIVTSKETYARLRGRGFPPLEHVPLGVNLQLFAPRGVRPRAAIPGIDPKRPVILYVGRLSPEKDLDVLWRAHEILERDIGSQLLVAGDGPLRRAAERFARRTPGVVYLGLQTYGESLAELYRAADVLAAPSPNETFSLSVVEALASGLPVVAVRQGGPAEILGGDGEAAAPGAPAGSLGHLARPGDPHDFARKLRDVIGRPAGAWRGRAHVEEHYSWERTFEKLLALYAILRREAVRETVPCADPSGVACG